MPYDESSMPVEQEGTDPVEPVEATNTSPSPPIPNAHPTQPVTNEAMEGQIEDIQDRVKRGELWMIGLTAAIALFALCSIGVGLLQWNVMKGQLKEMHDGGIDTHNLADAAKDQAFTLRQQFTSSQQVIESQRAAIVISPYSVDHPMTFTNPRAMSFAFTLALTNNGTFPANDVRMRYKIYFSQFGKAIFTEPGQQQRKLCNQPPPERVGNAPHLSIHPGQAAPEQINGGWGFSDQDINTVGLIPIVVGCVDYLSGAMPKWHQTGFIFEIRGKESRIAPGKDIPADSLLIDRYIFDQGDSY